MPQRKIHFHRILEQSRPGSRLRDLILGGQDGLVNVLGVTLGVATATNDLKIILIAALAATFAESISMGAVAYTSFKAEKDFYDAEVKREKKEIKEKPGEEKEEIRTIYANLGFTGALLNKIVSHITKNKKRWLDVMVKQELKLSPSKISPMNSALVVGFSALAGSFVPILPFFFLPISVAVWTSIIVSTIVLFIAGIYKAKITVGNPLKSGIELAVIGILAALAGYAIGSLLGASII